MLKFESLSVNVMVTIMMIVMVVLMPALDRFICGKLHVRLDDGMSTNPEADKILHIRHYILVGVFGLYLVLLAYVAFFSRSAADDYRVHVALFEDVAKSINIDFGILGFIRVFFTRGLQEAVSHVHISSFDNIAQVYLNVCMFIPMGYLLPYVFDWFRHDMRVRTVTVCFVASLLIENIQLITKLGFYDIDDLISNTVGGIVGMHLFRVFAYVLTHPDWRDDMKSYQQWRRSHNKNSMSPFFNRIHIVRTTIFASDEETVRQFYGEKLGFRLIRTFDGQFTRGLLYEFGKNQLEIRITGNTAAMARQNITIACNNSEYLKRNLEKQGIEISDYRPDPYTGLRTFSITGPDDTAITIIEE